MCLEQFESRSGSRPCGGSCAPFKRSEEGWALSARLPTPRATLAEAAQIRHLVETNRALGRTSMLAVRVTYFPTTQIDVHFPPPSSSRCHTSRSERPDSGARVAAKPQCEKNRSALLGGATGATECK